MGAPIAAHSYYRIERELTRAGQTRVFQDCEICLYEEKIVTERNKFPVSEVYDISYRRMGTEEGILYLHTRQGVYPYNVQSDPVRFIEAFKKLVGRNAAGS